MLNQANYIIKAFLLCFVIIIVIWAIKTISTTQQPGQNDNSINFPSSSDTIKSRVVNTKGELLFKNNCASCHNIFKDMTGPALTGVTERGPWADRKNIYEWIKNPPRFIAGNDYAKRLQGKYGAVMTAFPALAEDDIDAILEYITEASKFNQPSIASR